MGPTALWKSSHCTVCNHLENLFVLFLLRRAPLESRLFVLPMDGLSGSEILSAVARASSRMKIKITRLWMMPTTSENRSLEGLHLQCPPTSSRARIKVGRCLDSGWVRSYRIKPTNISHFFSL